VAEVVLSLVNEGIPFVLRPLAQNSDYGFELSGFGIEMRPFKYSMEYNVKDTSSRSTEGSTDASVTDETIASLESLPQGYINASAISEFGARFAGFMANRLAEKKQSYFEILRDVTANAPAYMHLIDATAPSSRDYGRIVSEVEPGKSFSVLNGRSLKLKNLDIFTLLDVVQGEQSVRQVLTNNLRVLPQNVDDLMTARLAAESSFILNFTSDKVVWLNDLENDEKYRHWDADVQTFLRSRYLPDVRKNLLNLILYADLSTPQGVTELISLNYLYHENFAVRIGVCPHFSMTNPMARKVGYAFHYLAKKNQTMAIMFIMATVPYCGVDMETHFLNPVKEEHFAAAYADVTDGEKDIIPWDELYVLFDHDSDETQSIRATHDYLQSIGIDKDVLLVNGKRISYTRGMGGMMHEIEWMFRTMQQIVGRNYIRSFDDETAVSILERTHLFVPSFDESILDERPIGLGVGHKSLSQQVEFVEWLDHIEWNYTDSGRIVSYYIVFTDNEAELRDFQAFAKKNHSSPSTFAINPPISRKMLSLFGLSLNRTVLIANGRVLKSFTPKSLSVLDLWTTHMTVHDISPLLKNHIYKRSLTHFFMSSVIVDWRNQGVFRSAIADEVFNIQSSLVQKGNNGAMNWDVIVDPFTRDFQRIAEIFRYVSDTGLLNVRMLAYPPNELSEPLPSFYRMALGKTRATFSLLDDSTTYSSMPDFPESWIAESMKAAFDLDNILTSELSAQSEGLYILTNLKIDGTCYDANWDVAEGAELALFDTKGGRKSDTVVMMTSGYWQLAANPGKWVIDLGGPRSHKIYEMVTRDVTVSSFAQKMRWLSVNIKPGMGHLKVYNISMPSKNSSTVNVFSVASGHLYERLLKIMMLAVRRTTVYNVKFWIIKNFLSPQFKATLPVLSQKYNFSYQLVSYKWPTWLRAQYEKQRIIWGNKILFLDVLFPLDLERVIYVDSDQICRTDLMELMTMDFEGAPYAFTPFCDSRKETEPFRFWKQGYWQNHLQGKNYHISALFAIDLNRFREMAAGDWLRYHYNTLSMDPSSLSNLDQDLPNYAQVHIPIYSLPQNWLWCETWCSDESLKDAKTIDLCNNPLTKKPKLYVAQTMVKEWPGLDEEVRNVSAPFDEYEKFFFPKP
jgi:UDP-glucose:glycoprotein glucosyltransferase